GRAGPEPDADAVEEKTPMSYSRAVVLATCVTLTGTVAATARAEKEPTVDGQTVGEWVARLADKAPAAKGDALDGLAAFGPAARPAVPAVVELTATDQFPFVRFEARKALERIGAGAVLPVFVLVLEDGGRSKALREGVCDSLPVFGRDAAEAVPALVRAALSN